jgi:AcrR family transcriptional regulator
VSVSEDSRPGTGGKRLPAAQRRRQILERATAIFAEKGLNGARVRDIAAACGVTEAILYRHFPSKEALFETALVEKIAEHDVEAFLAGLDRSAPLEETCSRIAERILEIGLNDTTVHRLLINASLSGSERTRGVYVRWRMPFVEYVENLIREGIESGELREVDPLLTARAMVGLVMDCVLSCQMWETLGYSQAQPGALIHNNVPTFVRGLRKSRES